MNMNETIFYKSPLGAISIQNEGPNISVISFVNRENDQRLDEKKIRYGHAKTDIIKKCIGQLDEYFAGTRKIFQFPIQQTGTDFQQDVWGELTMIPYGKTISYLELSKRIANVKAIRAVGTANGRNNIAIVVPCHRVIGSNGKLVGYGGDLWRKKWLIEHEAKYAHGVQTLF